jgi:hypothetical protein
MTWTIVDSCGLDVVRKPLAIGRAFRLFKKLLERSFGAFYISGSLSRLLSPGPASQSEPLALLFFPAYQNIPAGTIPGALINPEGQ